MPISPMKPRRFYPGQVARRLHGQALDTFGRGERAAVQFFAGHSRRLGLPIFILGDAESGVEAFPNGPLTVPANANRRFWVSHPPAHL